MVALAQDLGAILARTGQTGDDAEALADQQVGAVPSRDTIRHILCVPALPPSRQNAVAVGVALALLAGDPRPDVLAEEIRRLWNRAADGESGSPPPPGPPPAGRTRRFFDHLIEIHTESFAGRDGEIRAICEHVSSHDRGYLFVDGLSGYGKTSLLAALVREEPEFLYHFISQRYKTAGGAFDPTRLDDLLSNLCEQLDPHRDAPLSGRALTTRFLEVVAADRRKRTVLVLDAIDEVDQHPSFLRGVLPKRLPRNLFIVLSARSQGERSYLSEVGLTQDDLGLRLTLPGLAAEAVYTLLLRAGSAGAQLAGRDGFVTTLCEISGGDPFYLRFLDHLGWKHLGTSVRIFPLMTAEAAAEARATMLPGGLLRQGGDPAAGPPPSLLSLGHRDLLAEIVRLAETGERASLTDLDRFLIFPT